MDCSMPHQMVGDDKTPTANTVNLELVLKLNVHMRQGRK